MVNCFPGVDENGKFTPFRGIIQGPSGCGKTRLLRDMILNPLSPFDKILVFCHSISIGQPDYVEIENKFNGVIHFVDHVPIDDEEAERVFAMLQKAKAAGKTTLIVLDDMQQETLKGAPARFMEKLYTAGRHLGVSTLTLLQNMVHNRKSRLNATFLIVFRCPADMRSINFIADQVGGTSERSKRIMKAAYQAWRKGGKHGWFMFDLTPGAGPKAFRGNSFDRCFLVDPEDAPTTES